MNKEKCKWCGYEWMPRVKKPKVCTRCKRYDFRKVVKQIQTNEKES